MDEDKLKKEIEELITEGDTIVSNSTHNRGTGLEYINGAEYELWVTKCMDLMERHYKSHHLREKLLNACESAVGNGVEYYNRINSVLQILLSTEAIQNSEMDNDEEPILYEKIFISHASKDKDYVEHLIQLLNDIGIPKSRKSIFCSSFEGYNIPIGEKIYDYIKKQFNKTTLVIFVLSQNYYDSVASLNEMGATWVKSLKHISLLLPNFNFSSIEGAIDPTEISFKLDDMERLNSFKDDVIKWFNLITLDGSIWERDRKKFFENISDLVRRDAYSNSLTRVDIGRIKGIGENKLEIELRFINKGQLPVEFQELKMKLIDEKSDECLIEVKKELLSKYIIYGSENRREVITFDIAESKYDYRCPKKWVTDSYSIPAY